MTEDRPKTAARCKICKRLLDQPDDPTTRDCGGDCLRCMAEVGGDPACEAAMAALRDHPMTSFAAWWGAFNAALAKRGLPEARLEQAHLHRVLWRRSPEQAAEWERAMWHALSAICGAKASA